MRLLRTVNTALKALRRNPMRAMLTTLGIVIGIGAVIAMMEIGAGSSAQLRQSIASMGANVLLIMPGSTTSSSGVSQGSGSTITLTPQDCEALVAECPSLRAVAPTVRVRTQIVYGNRNWVPNQMVGSTAAFLVVRDWAVAEGEAFSDRDVLSASRVCLLGQTIATELFGETSALDKEIRVNNVPLRVVGVLARKGANMMGMDQDDFLLAPWTVVKYRIAGGALASSNQSASGSGSSGNTLSNLYPSDPPTLYAEQSSAQSQNHPMLVRFTSIDTIMAAARSSEQIPTAISEIRTVLRRQHHLRTGQENDFEIRDMAEMTNTLSSTTKLMTNLLLSVALISLVVGGVGIMNIMLVSVTERTREIGLRMAVGARGRDILRQFLTEAVMLTVVGGVAGIGLALLVGGALILSSVAVAFSLPAALGAFACALVTGVIFGFMPARKAARLDPVTALTSE